MKEEERNIRRCIDYRKLTVSLSVIITHFCVSMIDLIYFWNSVSDDPIKVEKLMKQPEELLRSELTNRE